MRFRILIVLAALGAGCFATGVDAQFFRRRGDCANGQCGNAMYSVPASAIVQSQTYSLPPPPPVQVQYSTAFVPQAAGCVGATYQARSGCVGSGPYAFNVGSGCAGATYTPLFPRLAARRAATPAVAYTVVEAAPAVQATVKAAELPAKVTAPAPEPPKPVAAAEPPKAAAPPAAAVAAAPVYYYESAEAGACVQAGRRRPLRNLLVAIFHRRR